MGSVSAGEPAAGFAPEPAAEPLPKIPSAPAPKTSFQFEPPPELELPGAHAVEESAGKPEPQGAVEPRNEPPFEPAAAHPAQAGTGHTGAAGETLSDSAEPCPACGETKSRLLFSATDRLYRTTDKVFQIVECPSCRLIRLSPQPAPNELRRYYPPDYWFVPEATTADRLEQWYRRFVLRDHLHFVERALRDSEEEGPVLDVGCGGGLFLQMLSERASRSRPRSVIGLDFSLDAAHVAWRRSGVPAVCATLSRPPFSGGSCAAVTMFHVLEHLYDPASYLDGAHWLLRPEGRLILQVPNAACWQFLVFGERWNGIDVPRHLIDFRLSDLAVLLDSCGFEILRYKHFSLRDNPAGMATSMAPGLDPMARRLRHVPETPRQRLWKDLFYVALCAASLPFTVFEAACRAGSTIMVEARKRS